MCKLSLQLVQFSDQCYQLAVQRYFNRQAISNVRRYLLYNIVANCMRWKSLMVVGLSYNLLEKICSSMQTISYFTQGSYCQQYYFTGNISCGCQLIHKNRESFSPQTIFNIWFYENTTVNNYCHYQNHLWQLATCQF